MNNYKTYADKGIQTGSVQSLSSSRADIDPSVFSYSDAPCNCNPLADSQSSKLSSPLNFPHESGAYIYSDTSLSDHSRHIPEPPTSDDQRTTRYGHLGYGKPGHLVSINDRIVSLPETSPPYRIAQQQSRRVVSMPENLKRSRYPHGSSVQYQDRGDHFNMSLISNDTTRTKSSEGEHTFLGGVPQTPSPPSSPESVVIIGNETRVPQAFLRTKPTVDERDHGSWTSWKGSPPKPIPALHGPLSLPYARCPSGAEGTVIEGEDLAHMIWGLESNGSQIAQPKGQSVEKVFKSLSHTISSRSSSEIPFTSHQDFVGQNLCNQEIIDLSQPEFHVPPSHRVSTMESGPLLRSYLSPLEDSHSSREGVQSRKATIYDFVRRDSPIHLYPSSFGFLPETKPWNAGLGIDLWRGTLEGGALLPSDSPFISLNSQESQVVLGRPLENTHSTQIYQTPRNLPIQDARAFEHLGRRSGVPTPPDTVSPQWSPRFRHSHFVSNSPELHYSQIPDTHSVHNSRRYVPHPTRDTFISSQQIQQHLFPAIPERHSAASEASEVTVEAHRLPPPYRSPDNLSVDHSTCDSQNDDTQFLPKARFSQDRPSANSGYIPSSPASPELRRGLTQHQPRSIPLARLIQRRLSSVVEEEVEIRDGSCTVRRPSPALSPSNPGQGLGYPSSHFGSLSKEEKRETYIPSQKTTGTNSSAGPLTDHAKRAYRPPGHPSRRITAGRRDAPIKSQKSPATDRPTISANHSEASTAVTQKFNTKSKRTLRKKKHAKKQDTVSTVPDK